MPRDQPLKYRSREPADAQAALILSLSTNRQFSYRSVLARPYWVPEHLRRRDTLKSSYDSRPSSSQVGRAGSSKRRSDSNSNIQPETECDASSTSSDVTRMSSTSSTDQKASLEKPRLPPIEWKEEMLASDGLHHCYYADTLSVPFEPDVLREARERTIQDMFNLYTTLGENSEDTGTAITPCL